MAGAHNKGNTPAAKSGDFGSDSLPGSLVSCRKIIQLRFRHLLHFLSDFLSREAECPLQVHDQFFLPPLHVAQVGLREVGMFLP